jgi:hypothetical protein
LIVFKKFQPRKRSWVEGIIAGKKAKIK